MHTRYQIPAHSSPRSGKLEAFLCLFDDPAKVVNHPGLSRAEKRALLASWASDSYAVENEPTIRRLDDGTLVPVERILSALNALDAMPEAGEGIAARVLPWRSSSRRGAPWRRSGRFFGRDDDNDPPPCPASIAPRPRAPGGMGATASVKLAHA